LGKAAVTAPIVGSSTPERIRDAAASVELQLAAEENWKDGWQA